MNRRHAGNNGATAALIPVTGMCTAVAFGARLRESQDKFYLASLVKPIFLHNFYMLGKKIPQPHYPALTD